MKWISIPMRRLIYKNKNDNDDDDNNNNMK